VRNADITRHVRPRSLDHEDAPDRDHDSRFTPARFFREAGTIIAICLALGVLTRLLLG
jgi:hypothetical protein